MTPTRLFIVTMSTTQGPYGPSVNMTYHRNLEDAQSEFQVCLDSVGEDPSTITLVEVDGDTLKEIVHDSFEGTSDDLEGEEE
jgi:hypothetical protein